jgi:methylated-DNA-protein-cysteine methyltransferase-like protein
MLKTQRGRIGQMKMAETDGTHSRINRVVSRIPKGRVATYGQIARLAGLRGQARLVGYAMHTLPAGTRVPWQRVVNARGEISLPGSSAARQRERLESEGVRFDARGRIDLDRFLWQPRRLHTDSAK